ncbi:Integrase, catalytic core protein [Phytophthora megakarya]|uniref:Integrase, catalytic core protein n=1 Tax=Phytophthora megakarya TaxID=4795 RepID=A0A225UX70_9STRA|nr:Integrase, catalytic core protein [Phytophthora megakarya]
MGADGELERRKARIVACGNEQRFGVDYSVTFAAAMEMSSVKLLLALGMTISKEIKRKLGVASEAELVLELQKAFYGLIQSGRLWSKLLQRKLQDAGFKQSLTDMCVYYRWKAEVLVVVGVYVDDLLVTGTRHDAVDTFFAELDDLKEDGYFLDQEATIMELLKKLAWKLRTP